MAVVKINRSITADELRELAVLVENQETYKFTNESIHINGDYAVIYVDVDEDGNINLL